MRTLSLFGFALLLGSIPLGLKAARRVSTYRQMQAWPKVHATITQSFVRDGSGDDGTINLAEFAFRYSVGGAQYTSSKHTEGTPFPGTEDDVKKMLKRFPVGATVEVAVNPADPREAVLDTGFPNAWNLLKRASVVAFVVGLAIMLADMTLAH